MSLPPEHLARLQGQDVPEEPTAPTPQPETPAEPEPEVTTQQLLAQNRQLADRLERAERLVMTSLQQGQQQNAPASPAPPASEPDWDNMTTKDIVATVIGEIKKGSESTRQELGVEIAKIRLEQQVVQAIDKYPDFLQYREDVVRITAEKDGRISPAEAYILAKTRRGEAIPTARTLAAPSSGARPGSGGTAKPQPAPANSRDAATRAFKNVFGGR